MRCHDPEQTVELPVSKRQEPGYARILAPQPGLAVTFQRETAPASKGHSSRPDQTRRQPPEILPHHVTFELKAIDRRSFMPKCRRCRPTAGLRPRWYYRD
jgi:hypothetical protein